MAERTTVAEVFPPNEQIKSLYRTFPGGDIGHHLHLAAYKQAITVLELVECLAPYRGIWGYVENSSPVY